LHNSDWDYTGDAVAALIGAFEYEIFAASVFGTTSTKIKAKIQKKTHK